MKLSSFFTKKYSVVSFCKWWYNYHMNICNLCPRECGANRENTVGYCGADHHIRIARAAPHMWEEPCISGERGSGAVFFTGCPLHCVFCQNAQISHGGVGRSVSVSELSDIFLRLQDEGVHNINLVTATQYTHGVIAALERAKPRLKIPVVWNSGGYEKAETIRALDGLIDIYLPDIKYMSSELSGKYSHAPDYFERAGVALAEMVRQCGKIEISDGIMRRGVIVRHLILPGCYKDSIEIVKWLCERYSGEQIMISLMSQYTPMPGAPEELGRRITTFEQNKVLSILNGYHIDGYTQERTSAKAAYIPPFET